MTKTRIVMIAAAGALIAGPWFAATLFSQNSPPAAPPAGGGITNRTFKVGSDFVRALSGEKTPAGAADPFAAEDPKTVEPVNDIQQLLSEELGIPFPEGTYIRHNPATGRLEIQHDPKVIAAIQAYFETLNPGEQSVNLRVEIYEVPALVALRLQQLTSPLADHAVAWKNVQTHIEQGKGLLVTTASVSARSGQRAKVENIDEVIYHTEIDWDEDEDIVIPAAFETRNMGTTFEVDPVIGPDDFTIDLNFSFEHHSAPPTMRPVAITSPKTGHQVLSEMPEFHTNRIVTQMTLRNGSVKLIGAWRPTGRPEFEQADVMQIAFLKADLVTTETIVPE